MIHILSSIHTAWTYFGLGKWATTCLLQSLLAEPHPSLFLFSSSVLCFDFFCCISSSCIANCWRRRRLSLFDLSCSALSVWAAPTDSHSLSDRQLTHHQAKSRDAGKKGERPPVQVNKSLAQTTIGLFSKKDFALDTHQVNSWGLKIVLTIKGLFWYIPHQSS